MTDGLRGVFPVLATAFDDDGSIDYHSQERLVDYLLGHGVHGLALFGNAGEGYTLLPEERRRLLETVVKRTGGRLPLVVGAGHTGTDAAVRMCVEAQDLGATALMVLPPYYLRPDSDGLMFYFESISKAVSIPIMVQDVPLLTQVAMPASLLTRMGREIENVRLVKVEAPPTPPKITAIRQAGADLVIFGGLNGQFLIEEFQRGAAGTMPNCDIPGIFVDIWNKLCCGDCDGAWTTFTRALPLIRFELQPGLGVSALKHNMVARGIIKSARVRHPTASLSREGLRELEVLRRMVERPEG